ncbi:sensor histidine kinase [Nitrosospira sp. NRS527]|uniref:sensor histidine kinase n=1 Tax=Nitrosospira sp. NRS527 TaxID=155925 RepID=UPI001AF032AD|nr:sensor histidine kinase [Nitrosospira sp. NRS527]BCT66965.1 Adaptive-response sensory-kinase SasA [Nitrosospira sp. NRS527]
MSTEDLTLDLLTFHAFPRLASALRSRSDVIIQKWETAVRSMLPAADELTLQQLRNSLPAILQDIVDVFESNEPRATRELIEGSRSHGSTRFHESYSIKELIIEYQLLRRIIMEQISEDLNEVLDTRSTVALNMAIDTALQSGVVTFTEDLQQQIKAAAEIQSKYLSFLSHDVRNHLNRATLHLQLLTAKLAQAPEYSESVEDIRSVNRAILQTISGMDRILQAEQLRQGSVEPHIQPVDLNFVLKDVAKQLHHEAESKGLELDVDVPEEAQTESDEDLLGLVLHNLLSNAIKYSSTGKIRITAGNRSDGEESEWVISISDQGPGIALESLAHLFDAFRRGDTYGAPGVGLGLSIVSHATRLLGGMLEVESKINAGSTFRLILPQR